MILTAVSGQSPLAPLAPADLTFLGNLPEASEPKFWEYAPGTFLAWNDYGDPSGIPVFYYHGWPSSRLQARLAHHLAAARGIRLISMDRPGIGRSSFAPSRTLDDWPALMNAFADHLGVEKFGQLGVSGGGPYVLSCAAAIPARLTGSAVLAGMVPLPLSGLGASGLHPLYRLLIPFRKAPAILFDTAFGLAANVGSRNPERLPVSILMKSLAPSDREVMRARPDIWPLLVRSFREGLLGGSRGVMADAEIYLSASSILPPAISHPIRYWHGGDDKNIPSSLVTALCSRMPPARLEIVPDLGHFSLAIRRSAAALDHILSASESRAP